MAAAAAPAHAHHSTNLSYDATSTRAYAGEFVRFRWINPHAIIEFQVTNAAGEKELWIAETHGAGVLGRYGWRPTMFKPGEKLVLTGNPPRKDGARAMHVFTVKAQDGKVYTVNRENP
jgi:hypothetical protein